MPAKIKILSFRKRPVDIDGISGKYLIDSLVSAGVLADDDPTHVSEVTHQQMMTKGQEQTVLIITFEGDDNE